MKKSLMFLIAVLMTAGLATAQLTGGDKAPKAGTGVVQTDAHADPRGSDEFKATAKSHKGGKKGHKGAKKGKKGTRKTKPNLTAPI